MTHSEQDASDRFTFSLTEDGRYRLLVDAVIDYAICMLDPDGLVTSWNSGAQRVKGYEEAEILGEHFSRFYTEEDRQSGLPERALATAAREGRYRGRRLAGAQGRNPLLGHVIIDPIRGSGGQLMGFAKITRDLTERQAAEEVLRRSDEQFRFLVQSVTDYSIFMLQPDGRVASWNAGAERIKGYRSDEIIGEHFSRFYTREDAANGDPQSALEIAHAREGSRRKAGESVKDGSRFWAHVVIDRNSRRQRPLRRFCEDHAGYH